MFEQFNIQKVQTSLQNVIVCYFTQRGKKHPETKAQTLHHTHHTYTQTKPCIHEFFTLTFISLCASVENKQTAPSKKRKNVCR